MRFSSSKRYPERPLRTTGMWSQQLSWKVTGCLSTRACLLKKMEVMRLFDILILLLMPHGSATTAHLCRYNASCAFQEDWTNTGTIFCFQVFDLVKWTHLTRCRRELIFGRFDLVAWKCRRSPLTFPQAALYQLELKPRRYTLFITNNRRMLVRESHNLKPLSTQALISLKELPLISWNSYSLSHVKGVRTVR